jgi:hypothetical protein
MVIEINSAKRLILKWIKDIIGFQMHILGFIQNLFYFGSLCQDCLKI